MGIHYTREEERTNYLSHAGGILLGIVVGIGWLIYCYRHDNIWMQWGIWLYLGGMLGSYIASTAYHACPSQNKWKEKLRKWDHAAIYWHIAGSYSPITLVALRESGYWGWTLFCFVWLCAIAGTIMSLRKLQQHSHIETICYILMGLVVLVAFQPLTEVVSPQAIRWIIAEGVCYVTGALFYSLYRRKYMHSVFHFFVLAGSICHIMAVWDILKNYI